MLFDALVLSGGRSTRLGESPKAELVFQGRTLLQRTVAATRDARAVAVVGPAPHTPLPPRVLFAREQPAFAGPAAAVAAGLAALARCGPEAARYTEPAPYTLVLACDMPRVGDVVERLLAGLQADASASDGVIAVDAQGTRQPLAAFYATSALAAAVAAHSGSLEGLSMRRLIAGMRLASVAIAGGETDDVDTWEDARRLGVRQAGRPTGEEGTTMDDREHEDQVLRTWAENVVEALQLNGLEVDINAVLGLAGRAAHAVLRPAAPLTTFIAGYAAGQAAANGATTPAAAMSDAIATATRLCREHPAPPAE